MHSRIYPWGGDDSIHFIADYYIFGISLYTFLYPYFLPSISLIACMCYSPSVQDMASFSYYDILYDFKKVN